MSDTPKRRWLPRYTLRTLFVVVTVAAAFAGWAALQWQIVQERREVANWINQRNHDAHFSEYPGILFHSPSPASTGRVRYILGDKSAAWVYVQSPITERERNRIVAAFPEAKQYLHVEGSPEADNPGPH